MNRRGNPSSRRPSVRRPFILSSAIAGLIGVHLCPIDAEAATVTWDGGSTDDFLRSGGNWVGDSAPSAGDQLIFDGFVRFSPNNNFPSGTAFSGISFTPLSGAFTLQGNAMT